MLYFTSNYQWFRYSNICRTIDIPGSILKATIIAFAVIFHVSGLTSNFSSNLSHPASIISDAKIIQIFWSREHTHTSNGRICSSEHAIIACNPWIDSLLIDIGYKVRNRRYPISLTQSLRAFIASMLTGYFGLMSLEIRDVYSLKCFGYDWCRRMTLYGKNKFEMVIFDMFLRFIWLREFPSNSNLTKWCF